jgi:hypothetical protein
MGEYYAAKTSSILFQGSASRASFSKRWKLEGISCRFRLLPPLVNTYLLNVNMYIYIYVHFLKAANGIIKSDKCYIVTVSACIFEILPIIQVLECQNIFHLLEKLVLDAIVQRSGLVIHPEQRCIAGSPDGIVSVSTGETGLI